MRGKASPRTTGHPYSTELISRRVPPRSRWPADRPARSSGVATPAKRSRSIRRSSTPGLASTRCPRCGSPPAKLSPPSPGSRKHVASHDLTRPSRSLADDIRHLAQVPADLASITACKHFVADAAKETVDARGLAVAVDHHTIAQIKLYVRSAQVRPNYRTCLMSGSPVSPR